MRDARIIAIGLLAPVVAWVADRLLWTASANAGSYAGDNWSRELLLAADRLPKIILLGLLGWIVYSVLRRGMSRPVALLLLAIGLALGALPTVVFLARFEPLLPFVSTELFWPRHFVLWTSTGLLLLGLVGIAGRLRPIAVGPWARVALAVAAIGLTWPADALLAELFVGAAQGRTVEAMLIVELLARAAVLSALLGLCLMTIGAAPHPRAGGVMVLVGGVAFIGFALVTLLVGPAAGLGLEPEPGVVTGYLGRWMSGGVLLVGAWELLRSRSTTVARTPPPEAAATASPAGA